MVVPSQELEQVRARLLARRRDLQIRTGRVERDLARQNDPLVADFADQAIQMQNDETLSAIGDAARQEIQAIDLALQQIASGRYGTCQRCGEDIPEARLQAAPQSVTCAACATA